MPSKLIHRIKMTARKRFKPCRVKIDGLWFLTDPARVPKDIRKALYSETYEECERRLAVKALQPGDRVLEIGAGVGFVSTICASICGPDSLLSYEPNPIAAAILRHNFQLNGMSANVRERGIATEAREGEFFFNSNIFSSSIFDRSGLAPSIVKFDALVDVVRDFKPTTIVMDAEGAEIDLLPQFDPSQIRSIIVEMHPHIVGEDKCEEAIAALSERGYAVQERCRQKIVWLERRADFKSSP